ncbi:MAG: undecaprenyl/decaprenyl-phosphate alpha-N-acetylglucosaminyl 1-phosphate transferase [Phycisphaerae bacterium]|nr:undecaprenyl/decaprenyl-phosphate alpha-N-acetylglucosaminyl 1-phosphate transferase [Phycisphaerae bacterium]
MPLALSLVDVVRGTWWIGVVALGVSLVATPIIRWIAYRARVVDRPDTFLKPHRRPVAYMGGLAMCTGLLAGLACWIATVPDLVEQWNNIGQSLVAFDIEKLQVNPLLEVISIAIAAVWITIVGLLDDLYGLRPRQKIFGQALAALVLLVGGGGTGMAGMFCGLLGLHLPLWALIPIRGLILFVLVVCTCNATNLLDGLDGLCGGVTGIIALGYLGLAVWLASFGRHPGTDELRVGVCLAMVGAVLGFLPYNIPPASIFMGDAGSMLLGFFVAAMMALFAKEGALRWLVAACVVYALPILDTALAVVRRLRAGVSIFAGDRSHLYDQLVDRGMTVKQVVVLFYILATMAAVVGVVVATKVRLRYAVVLYAVLLIIVWGLFIKLGMVTPRPRKGPAERDASGGDE